MAFMRLIAALFLCVLDLQVLNAQSVSSTLSAVISAFSKAKIVPDVLPSFAPTAVVEVVFTDPGTMKTVNVTAGMNLTTEQTLMEPQFFLVSNQSFPSNQSFVLALVDPDAPTPQDPSVSQFRHLLGGDFKITDSMTGLLANSSPALTDFVNPTPPVGSDPHRYVILVFNQPSDFESAGSALVNSSTPRTNFNITTFGSAVGLGMPIAGNFFLTGPDMAASDVAAAFEEAGLVPDVLPSFSPTSLLDVVFTDPATGTATNITPGMSLTMEQTSMEPQFFLTSNKTFSANQSFVLTMVDPDAPTPQNTSSAQIRHFIGSDFKVINSTTGMLSNSSAALTEFASPHPPAGSDPHRYTLLLFLQPSNFDSIARTFVNASTPRNNFNLTTFINEVGLGSPIAGNFFLTGPTANATSSSSVVATATSPAGSGVASQSAPPGATNGSAVTRHSPYLVGVVFAVFLCMLAC